MTPTKEELGKQLAEYRKASRALIWLYDSSSMLFKMFFEEDGLDPNGYLNWEENDLIFNDTPSGVSSEAVQAITELHNWSIRGCTQEKGLVRKGGVLIDIQLYLDYFPQRPADESLSAILIEAWRLSTGSTRKFQQWDDLPDTFSDGAFSDCKEFMDDNEVFVAPMPLTVFDGVWTPSTDLVGDYAFGLYDLSELPDEKSVKEVLTEINNLIDQWCA